MSSWCPLRRGHCGEKTRGKSFSKELVLKVFIPLKTKHFYEFKNFRLDPDERVLLRDGKPLSLTPKAFHLLRILVENHGHIVDKENLITEIWADSFVEDGNLAVSATMLRKALADNANSPTFIETIPRRGYRFIAAVKENCEEAAPKAKLNGSVLAYPLPRESKPIAAFLLLIAASIVITAWYAKSGVSGAEASAPILSAPFRSDKFSTSGNVDHAIVSPDGKYAAFTDATGGKISVWLRQLETSENIQIVPPSDTVYFGLAFSNDGNSLYFVRRKQDGTAKADIYRVITFGGIPVKVIDFAEGWISLSPDDKQISFVRCEYKDDDFCSLFLADADGKNERKLLTRPRPIRIGDNQFSPDGKSIAFAVGQSWDGGSDFRLMQIDLATRAESEITPQTFFNIKSLKWLPDSGGLLFTANENSKLKIWRASTATGKALPVTKDAANYSAISLDRNAERMIATQVSDNFRLYLSSTGNLNDAKILTAAHLFTFAPDGKIVYNSASGDIWTINRDGGEQRQLTNNAFGDFEQRVSPDGRFIFFTSNRTGDNQVWRMNADGSNQLQLTEKEGGYPFCVSPDEKWVYYKSGLRQTLWKVSTEGGAETQVFSERKILQMPASSPNGNLVAYFFRDDMRDNQLKIGVMTLEDKKTVKTLAIEKADPVRIAWLNNSRTLIYITQIESKNLVWQQSLDEGQPHLIADLGGEEIGDFAVSPDGSTFGFIRGRWTHDAVLIMGLK